MQITFNQFEQIIDETILQRGYSYFKSGHVLDIDEISPGKYEAIVEGTEDYIVQLTLKNGIITEYVCSCPYDMGPVCKHVAAVIFYLQQEELELNKKTINTKTGKPAKYKNIAEQVDDFLEKATHEELKQFIREKSSANIPFRNLFLSSFTHYNSYESKELYIKQVKSIIKTATGRNNFIDWSNSNIVGNAVDNLLQSAKSQIEKQNYQSAIFICTAVMEQMVEAFQYADDSNGDIGGCIDSSIELLNVIAKKETSEEIRKQLIEFCFTAFDNEIFSGWDWHIDILRLTSFLVATEEETERLLKQIDKAIKSEYDREEAQFIKYNVLHRVCNENVAEEYLEYNISNPKLRHIAIKKAFDNDNFEKAILIAKEGIDYDKIDKQGLVLEWYDWLLKIAQTQNKIDKIIEFARILFISNFSHEQDYYKILKHFVKTENWVPFLEGIIQDITAKKRWLGTDLIASIYVKEEWWDRLLELVKKSPELDTIAQYEKYLSKNYANELAELYANSIKKYLINSIGRNHYQNACRYIRKIIKLGAREKANELISHLRTEYPKRKALMEELVKV